MDEKRLRSYHAAFAKALVMLLRPREVTNEAIAACIRQTGKGAINRLFCLAVRRELKLQAAETSSMPPEQYKAAVTDIWRLFKQFIDGDGSDAFWDNLVENLGDVMERYGHCQLIVDLAVHVVLAAIEEAREHDTRS